MLADTANLHTFVDAFRFIGDNPSFLLQKAWEQLVLSGAALGLALLVALPLGIALGHFHRGSGFAIGASIFGRGLPSLVLIAAFLTILGTADGTDGHVQKLNIARPTARRAGAARGRGRARGKLAQLAGLSALCNAQ